MAVYDLLVIVHIIGTVLGVGAATFAEIHYTRFNSDDIITDDERKTLAVTYTVMRTGLFLLVISGFGFLLYLRPTSFGNQSNFYDHNNCQESWRSGN